MEFGSFCEDRKMISLHQADTVSMKQCCICDGQLLATDKFCRWCGSHQRETREPQITAAPRASRSEHKTRQLGNNEEVCQSISGMLLKAMAKNVAVKTGPLQLNRFGVFVVASVIAVPMWLLIILLSPLDAYTSAKAASSRMNVQ